MKTPLQERGQALILLGAWLFFGGGAASALLVYDRPVSEIRKAIGQVIADEGRRKMILDDIDHWESGQEKLDEKVAEDREQLLDTFRHRDVPRAATDPILARLDAQLSAMDRDFLDLRFTVKEQVTSSEWAAIVALPGR
jgi:hypothetical protein